MVYSDGYYYLLTTTWTDVEIAQATTIAGLESATKTVVFSATDADHCCNVWAPEVHYLGGAWYIYYTAGTADSLDGQNIHVLKGMLIPKHHIKSHHTNTNNRWRHSSGHLHLRRPTHKRLVH